MFSTAADLAKFSQSILRAWGGEHVLFEPAQVRHFLTTSCAPNTSWRLGWDTPSIAPNVSHAGDLWPRNNAVGHLGFTGCSLWLSLDHGAYAVLLTNRVHPTRDTSGIRELRRDVMDWVAKALGIASPLR